MKSLCYSLVMCIFILSSCSFNSESSPVPKHVKSEFKEVGIVLKEQTKPSETFTVSGADAKQYEFEGGTIYLIYDFEDKERMIDQLKKVLAETEFPFTVKKLYKENFSMIYVPTRNDTKIDKKIQAVISKLMKETEELKRGRE